MPSTTTERRILVLLAAVTVSFLIYGIAAGAVAVAYYVPITIVLVAIFWRIHLAVGFSSGLLWGLALVAAGNLAGGVLLVDGAPLYQLEVLGPIQYDKLFHAAATGVGAWAAYEALVRWGVPHRPLLVFAAVMLAIGGGALVEIVEYFGSLLIENNSVGDYANNMQDLIANTVGASVAATWAYRATPG